MLTFLDICIKVVVWLALTKMLFLLWLGNGRDVFWDSLSIATPQIEFSVMPCVGFSIFLNSWHSLYVIGLNAYCVIYVKNTFFHSSLTIIWFMASFLVSFLVSFSLYGSHASHFTVPLNFFSLFSKTETGQRIESKVLNVRNGGGL